MGVVSERVLAVADAELVCQSLGIRLGKRTNDHVQMLCPFPEHQDKNFGNCQLTLSKKLFFCFACGKGGSIIDVVMLHHGWDTDDKKKSYDAMKEICSICGADESIVSDKPFVPNALVPPSVTEDELRFLGLSNDSIIDRETGETIAYAPLNKLRLEDSEAYCMLILNKAKEAIAKYRGQLNEELSFVIMGNSQPDTKYWLSGLYSNIGKARGIEEKFLQYLVRRTKKIGKRKKN